MGINPNDPKGAELENVQRTRVVYVDDDINALRALQRVLREFQREWELTVLDNGQDAFECLAEQRNHVLITDWMMPGMDGLALCKKIRDKEANDDDRYTYIVLLTGKQDIANVVQALESGADDFLSKPYDQRELIARIRAGVRIVDLQQKLRESNKKLALLASTDGLTGLLNRRRGTEILHDQLDLLRRGKQDLSVITIDLDRFKSVNDTYGHEAGDTLIKAVAQRLREACRQYDSVIRWGGDEFVVVCPHTSKSEIPALAERVRSAVARDPVEFQGGIRHNVTISVGTASVAAGCDIAIDGILEGADQALYAAKHKGRNCVEGWTPSK